MLILEQCPYCGHDLLIDEIPNFPSSRYKYCDNCGWNYEEELLDEDDADDATEFSKDHR